MSLGLKKPRARIHIGVALAAIAAGGCASHQPSTTSPALAVKSESQATEPTSSPLAASLIVDLTPGEASFAIIDDKGAHGGRATIRTSATTEHGAEVAVAEGERRVEFLKRSEDGCIALTAVIDRKEHALTLFEPPLIVAPASLQPGETFSSEAAMRVVALDDPGKQREKGKAKRSITYVGDAMIPHAGGEVRAAKLEIRFDADLRMANAHEQTTLYVSRDASRPGVIAQESMEKITILGAFPRTTKRTLVREQ